jgi:diguanylate cyclase (GGDEF)-like protein
VGRLPGADTRQAAAVAEDLRTTILAQLQGGLRVTMSLGVSASQPSAFDYEHVFQAADQALYAAKAAGRNCVRVAGAPGVSFETLEKLLSEQPKAMLPA